MNILELDNNLNNNNNLNLEQKQNNFLESILGKAINTGMDIGIRTIFPDLVEDQIINLKDNLIKFGLKDGINKTINDVINFGKSAIGIVTGNFENINQIDDAIKSGGLIDSFSTILEQVVNKANKKGVINNNMADMLKKGKDIIVKNAESDIKKKMINQSNCLEQLNNYMNKWNECFKNKDFEGMEKEYIKINKELSNLVPLENSLLQARKIENIHNIIKNNGHQFNLSDVEIKLLNNFN